VRIAGAVSVMQGRALEATDDVAEQPAYSCGRPGRRHLDARGEGP
jgi:hypothetical protein